MLNYLAEMISSSKKISTIKLMKNKITDESLNILMGGLCKNGKIQVLNLNYNLLTDKCLEKIVKLFKKTNLKKLYLLNNNFSSTRAKLFVKEMKNFNVEIYL